MTPSPRGLAPQRMWPWTVTHRAFYAVRYAHDAPVVLIFATIPTVWAILLAWPGPTLRGRYSAVDNLGGEWLYATILGALAGGLWLGLCRVIPRCAYRAVIVVGVAWWLFLGSTFMVDRGVGDLMAWSFVAQALYGVLAFLSAGHDHDADTASLVARMVQEDVFPPVCAPIDKDGRRGWG